MPEEHGQWRDPSSGDLGEDALAVFRLWREYLVFHDPRYHNKELSAVARRSMTDGEFRDRLVNDTEAALSELPPGFSLPDVASLRFHENTADTLNVVLPPRASEVSARTPAFRDLLKSRTAASPGVNVSASFLRDDFDVNVLGGDPDLLDFLLVTVATH
jgi:hypothetical protein